MKNRSVPKSLFNRKYINRKTIVVFAVVALLFAGTSYAQTDCDCDGLLTQKKYNDSLVEMDYKRTFPILGKKAYKRGYDIPFPWGMSLIYFTQRQEITINRTQVGINGSEMADFSDYINFGPTIATTNAYTFRPDLWLLPFLNIYGVLGGGTTQTDVNLLEPIGFQTSQQFGVSSFGIGITLAGKVGPLFMVWDNNYNFADVEVVVEPVPAFNSSFRVGPNFRNPHKPEAMLSVWAGVFYQSIQNDTQGSIALKDIFPNAGNGNAIAALQNWAADLPVAQRVVANQIINKLEEYEVGALVSEATIDYKLNKEVSAPFNMILGAQYQFDKNWMLRTELGVFGKRSQFLLNLNYRFQGLGKK